MPWVQLDSYCCTKEYVKYVKYPTVSELLFVYAQQGCAQRDSAFYNSFPSSEMNITGTLPQAGNLKLFVRSLPTQSSTRPKQNIFNVVLMRPDKTE